MMLSVGEAVVMVCAMGAVIFSCRAFPFLFFSGEKALQSKGTKAFLDFIELIAPPAAMTVLTFNALGPSLKGLYETAVCVISSVPLTAESRGSLTVLIAAALTAALHLLKRNPLISIFGGTAAYMILQRIAANA